ncbi:glycoside hydrolase family 43 protein [Gorillibacterium sp. sgz500922]|uniref:glycoside hydrolase family 43 protein n=1 Tax=Gorillibacterium sp. sgz500922 TaxID=3446694 RepID=UPI003F680335
MSHFQTNTNGQTVGSGGGKTAQEQEAMPLATAVGKVPGNGNPLMGHKFGADPYALVYGGRVYLYMTSDALEYDSEGQVKGNTYSSINRITVISSDDLVNWTDHGEIAVAGPQGAAKWATQSWAPAAAHRVVDGKDAFFLYFANNASGIGVLTADSPIGPWTDPIGEALVTRSTPGVEDVTWLFDPAVLVDEDGRAYLYFGGGIPEGQHEWPNTARVMELGSDMISVQGEAVVVPAPFMFEDAGINKHEGVYYYSYCSNFYEGDRPQGSPPAGEIAYMTSEHPMGPWTYRGTILKNPGHFFGVSGNNHHAIFRFQGEWYIAYHAQTLAKALGLSNGYRSTHLNKLEFRPDGLINEIQADYAGVPQLKPMNPYERIAAGTIGWSAGVRTKAAAEAPEVPAGGADLMAAVAGTDGSWLALARVDFGQPGATAFTASIWSDGRQSAIELRLDQPDGKLIGTLTIPSTASGWSERSVNVAAAEDVHDLYLVFRNEVEEDLLVGSWQFSR